MKTKKSPQANLEKKRIIFLEIGLILSLGICLAAFEWSSEDYSKSDLGNLTKTLSFDEDIQITIQTPPPVVVPPPPSVIPETLLITDKKTDDDPDDFITDPVGPVSPIIITPYIPEDIPEDPVEIIDWVKVEVKPAFPGGEAGLLKFISDHTKYPEICRENGIQGKVFVQFVIGADGIVTNVSVVKGVDKYLDEEALRVVSSLPAWTPGKQRGKSVPVSYIIPIKFVLSN
ncbi:MAG: energy transducer TonB [Bacteroidales bacterium]|nr:energy transducer TonB [Bacteroidales bacterium]